MIGGTFLCMQVQEEMRNGEIELEKYVITKSLTKPPEDYPDAKNQPHVQVSYLFMRLTLSNWDFCTSILHGPNILFRWL